MWPTITISPPMTDVQCLSLRSMTEVWPVQHLILEDEHSCQSRNKGVIQDQLCRSKDKSFQEEGDDGNRPASHNHIIRRMAT